MIYYFYNNTNFVITLNGRSMDEMIVAQKVQGVSTGDRSIIGAALALSPKSWIKAVITDEKPLMKSLYEGQLRSLKEKGYVRVLTETEYRDECKRAKLESDTGILHQDTSVSSVGIYRKVAEHNETVQEQSSAFSFSGLMVDDLEEPKTTTKLIQEELQEEITPVQPQSVPNQTDARISQIENALLELTKAVSALSSAKKSSKGKSTKRTKKAKRKC